MRLGALRSSHHPSRKCVSRRFLVARPWCIFRVHRMLPHTRVDHQRHYFATIFAPTTGLVVLPVITFTIPLTIPLIGRSMPPAHSAASRLNQMTVQTGSVVQHFLLLVDVIDKNPRPFWPRSSTFIVWSHPPENPELAHSPADLYMYFQLTGSSQYSRQGDHPRQA